MTTELEEENRDHMYWNGGEQVSLGEVGQRNVDQPRPIYLFFILGSAASTVLTWKNVKGLS